MISYLFVLLVAKCEAIPNPVFSDEFNVEHTFDWSKWRMEGPLCVQGVYSLYCGIRVINGTYTVMRDNFKCRNIYTPSIRTKRNFIFGRFEIRSSLPREDYWDYSISLDPVINSKNYGLSSSSDSNDYGGVIHLMYTSQDKIKYAVIFGLGDKIITREYDYEVEEDLHDFNVYAMEWTETQLKWFFNERVLFTFNITQELANNYNPFDKPFKLLITMWEKQVFVPNLFVDGDLSDYCPIHMVDYVRVYQNYSKEDLLPINHNTNNVTRAYLCERIQTSLRPKPEDWRLVYSDEFKGISIDERNWDVKHQVDYQENVNQSQAKRTSSLVVSDGALILGIFQDVEQPVQSSSFLISWKKSFTYGKIVIRAALPEGIIFKPSIYLEQIEGTGIERLEIVSDFNGTYLGIDFPDNEDIELINHKLKKPILTGNPFGFHTYVLEWTERELIWTVDDNLLYRTKFGKDYNDFCKPFKLTISLPTVDRNNTEIDGKPSTTCPLLILDYVRVYQVLDNSSRAGDVVNVPEPNLIDRLRICKNIMQLYQKSPQNDPSSYNLILIISISSITLIVIIVIIIALNVCLFKRLKSKNKPKEEIYSNDKFYDDVREMENIYADPNDYNQYQVVNDYHEYNEYSTPEADSQSEDNYYTKITNKYGIEQAPRYLDMEAKAKYQESFLK